MTNMQQSSNLCWQQGLLSGHLPYRRVHVKKSHVQSAVFLAIRPENDLNVEGRPRDVHSEVSSEIMKKKRVKRCHI